MTLKFRTSTDKAPKVYTIATMGEIDTVVSLLGWYLANTAKHAKIKAIANYI